jgi:PAS domain S-box-containing protein
MPHTKITMENPMVKKGFPPVEGRSILPNDQTAGSTSPSLVVGIGAAGGALKTLRKILTGLPSGRGVAVILAHHPELAGKNLLTLLKRQTTMEVVEALNGMTVLADRIHVMPPDRFLSIAADRLTLQEAVHCNGLLMPIDHFFCSLAADRKDRCCGILLSGAGSDGMLGLSEIRAARGRTIAEDPKGARIPDMPQSAVDAGTVDDILPAGAIAGAVAELAGQVATRRSSRAALPEPEAGFRAIMDILRSRGGHDFRCYKSNTLGRRIHRRMNLVGIATLDDYALHLSDNPDEVDLLQKDLLIGVTEFFRQPQAWETLERKIITPLVENAASGSVIRVWIPGCSLGKEVYTLAILLAEQARVIAGEIDFQVFATDADYTALAAARSGYFAAGEIGPNVSPERLKRFFSRRANDYQIIKTLRGRVIFATQNITADPPFSRLDLIICRNLLIYLEPSMQKKIITLFHFALRDEGFLFLGNSETIGGREDLFEPISKKWRIYRRIGIRRAADADISVRPAKPFSAAAVNKSPAALFPRQSLTSAVQQLLLDRFAPASVLIDRNLQILYMHGAIDQYLTFPTGEPTTRVTDMAREGLRARLRGVIGKSIESGRTSSFTTRTRRGGKSVPVKATISPLQHLRGSDGLLLITFEDQRFPAMKSGRTTTDCGDVQQLADELKMTREDLQGTIDQLEGSNEQLKASNEEVVAANEELQAASEEMETSKEELQSLNEELNTINVRLEEKINELESVNNDVTNLLTSTSIATVFLDRAFRIKRYTPAITELMSLIPSDMGRPIGDILLRFTDEALLNDARHVLVDLTPLSKEVRADDGRWHIRRITPYRTQDDRIEGVVITFVDIMEIKLAEEALREAHKRAVWLARFPDENPIPVMRASAEGRVLYCNPASMKNMDWRCGLGNPLPDAVRTLIAPTMESGKELHREIRLGPSFYAVTLMPFPEESYVNIYVREITKRKQAEEELLRSRERLLRAQEIAHLGSWELNLTDNRLTWSDEVYRIFGLQPQEFAATYEAFLELVHPDDRKAVDDAYSGSIRDGRDRYEIEHRVIRKHTGEIRFVQERCRHDRDESGRIVRSMGMVHDITDLRHAEEALRESEAHIRMKLQSILSPEGDIGNLELADIIDVATIRSLMTDFYDLVPIPMSIIDLKGQVIVGVGWQEICTKFHRVHPETCRNCMESDKELSSGILPGESKLYKCKNHMWDIATPIIIGCKHVGNVFSGQFFFEDEQIDYDLFRSQAGRFGFDEADYIAALESVPRLSREEVKTGMAFFMKFADLISQMSYANIKLARSVSERDALMASLAATNRTLETRSEQLAAANRELESFSYSVSHDLQSPLRAIDGYSRMILRKHAECFDSDALSKFEVIRANAQRMSRLIDDLLSFSRLGKAHLSAAHLEMDVMIREVWEEIRAANPDRSLKLSIGAIPPAAGDRALIRQVLVNLLSNAVKFTRQRPEALIEVGGQLKDSECVYTVRDNGVGFDMQYHDKMFGVFQRLHSNDVFEGTGVGLAIVQRIVHRHGGRVWAEGKVGQGACLYFSLPSAKAAG